MALVDELVKARGASMDGFPQIKCPADVNDAYLDSELSITAVIDSGRWVLKNRSDFQWV